MNFSKQYIAELSSRSGFIANNIEKVIRLIDVLDFIFTKSSFKDALALKGGTAINLVYTHLDRLSVDIDLDYHRHLDKDKALIDRESLISELDAYMKSNDYLISSKSRGSVILASRTYSYINASGNNDNIKVEVNFINRINLFSNCVNRIDYFGKSLDIITPSKEELYGMKIAALLDRNVPRDLFDADYLFKNLTDINLEELRKIVLFYLSLDGIYEVNQSIFDGINAINDSIVKKELLPVLKKGDRFNLNLSKSRVVKNLSNLLILDENELMYLDEFSKDNYRPDLLFDATVAKRAIKHPMAKWRSLNLKSR